MLIVATVATAFVVVESCKTPKHLEIKQVQQLGCCSCLQRPTKPVHPCHCTWPEASLSRRLNPFDSRTRKESLKLFLTQQPKVTNGCKKTKPIQFYPKWMTKGHVLDSCKHELVIVPLSFIWKLQSNNMEKKFKKKHHFVVFLTIIHCFFLIFIIMKTKGQNITF